MRSEISFSLVLKLAFSVSFAFGFLAWFLTPEIRPFARVLVLLIQGFVTALAATWAYYDYKERKYWRERRETLMEIKKQLEKRCEP